MKRKGEDWVGRAQTKDFQKLRIKQKPQQLPGRFASRYGKLYMDDKPLYIKGVNWAGFQTTQGVVHGLYAQPIQFFLDLLTSEGVHVRGRLLVEPPDLAGLPALGIAQARWLP